MHVIKGAKYIDKLKKIRCYVQKKGWNAYFFTIRVKKKLSVYL